MTASPPARQFAVVTDGGMDPLPSLHNDVPVAPFSVNFGEKSYPMNEITTQWLYQELQTNPVHPTSSQPAPASRSTWACWKPSPAELRWILMPAAVSRRKPR